MWIGYFLQGAGLGLSASATPGPLQALLIARAAQHGWKRTLPAVFAPLLSDGPIVALVLLLLTQLPAGLIRFIRLAGGIYVIYLALRIFQTFCTYHPAESAPQASQRSLLQAIGINLLNPNPYLFWSMAAGPTVLQGWAINPGLALTFVGGFYLVFILSSILLIVLFSTARSLGPRAIRILLGCSSLALLIFGAYQIYLGSV